METTQLLTPTQIVKSKRKSISLIIKNNGDFIVRAPSKVDETKIFEFINLKSDWIIRKRTEVLTNQPKSLRLENGEIIALLGEEYKISTQPVNRAKISENQIILPLQNSKDHFIKLLKKYAKKYLEKRTEVIAHNFNLTYNGIIISSARTCWGSCSFNNKLHFTYKLMLCPKVVVDYIIIHELCHTKIKNHSSSFWGLVGKLNPDYKNVEKWLKQNRGIIECI